MNELTAFVLAGGKSTRMGQDKALLELDGETLLVRVLKLARLVAPQVRIIGDAKRFAPWGDVVEDIYPEHGPLGGIHAALTGTRTDLNLVLPVDMPFLDRAFLEFLIQKAAAGSAVVTVPRAGGRLHPLCATYRKSFAEIAKRSLESDRNRIDALFDQVETRVIEEDELRQHGFAPWLFRNVNTPQDWRDVQGMDPRKRGSTPHVS
ncbi:MAG TPA: molybdenum cofactor guanylyltransferase [Terriglobales bacterium]|nr:molybdenum cofactor guanylyltransferase [Terriglobales bacterium]